MALDGHQVTHLLVKRGLLFPKRFAVPFDRLARVDQEGLYLDLSILELLSSPIARETGDGSPEVELSRQTRLLLADGAKARLTGLRLFHGKRAVSHLLVRCGGSRRSTSLLPVSLVAEFGPTQMTAHVGRVDVDGLPTYRADQDIANDLWESLYGSGEISLTDLNGIRGARGRQHRLPGGQRKDCICRRGSRTDCPFCGWCRWRHQPSRQRLGDRAGGRLLYLQDGFPNVDSHSGPHSARHGPPRRASSIHRCSG